jgi:hypothetical protein
MSSYNFSITNDTENAALVAGKLAGEITNSSITAALDSVSANGDAITIAFSSSLSAEEQTTLAAVLASHDGIPIPESAEPQEVTVTQLTDFDDTGRPIVKSATTDSGWAYLAHGIEMTTSKDNSAISKDYKGNDRGDLTIRFYDSNGDEITDAGSYSDKQDHIDNECVETRVTFKFGKDIDIISGMMEQLKSPKDGNGNLVDFRLWVLIGIFDNDGIPFDPDGPGTAWEDQVTEFVAGINLKYLADVQLLKTDGRSGKKLLKTVNAQIPYEQNQIQFIMKHPTGFQHDLMAILEYYRAI